MKNILIYSHDTYGLGNIRRTIAIANKLAGSDAQKNVLILSGSPVAHSFRLSERIDYVKLPCLVRTERNQYKSKFLDVHNEQILKLRSSIIQATVRNFTPNLITVDKNPCGVANELTDTLNDIRHYDTRPSLVLLLRDILDEPAVTKRFWRDEGYDRVVCEDYDRVLVVGEKRVFDLAKAYDFSTELQRKLYYCGYIEKSTRSQSIRNNVLADSPQHLPLVLVMAGGGQDGYALLKNYLRATQPNFAKNSYRSVVISGPELPQSKLKKLYTIAENCLNTEIVEFTNQMESYINAAEVVICMGGYNTVCEVMAHRKKTICVPRNNPATEQIIRARRLQELGLLNMVHPNDLSPDTLSVALQNTLNTANKNATKSTLLNFDGLENIDAHVNELIMIDETTSSESLVSPHVSVA